MTFSTTVKLILLCVVLLTEQECSSPMVMTNKPLNVSSTGVTEDTDLGNTDINVLMSRSCLKRTCGDPISENDFYVYDYQTIFRNTNRPNVNYCCLACSCSGDCYVSGNCCADKEQTKPKFTESSKTENGYICMSTIMESEFLRHTLISSDITYGKLLKQSCLNLHSYSDNLDFCVNPRPDVYNHLAPVYSKNTSTHYANRFCALCNDEDPANLIVYTLKMQCNTPQFPMSTDNLFSYIRQSNSCIAHWRHENLTEQAKRCYLPENVISKCTGGSYWKLAGLCEKADFMPVFGIGGLYRNIYCKACFEAVTDFCSFDFAMFMDVTRFSIVLSISEPRLNDMFVLSSQCESSMTYINELGECLNVSCPLTEMRIANRCFPLVRAIARVNLDYRISLRYPKGIIPPPLPSLIQGLIYDVINQTGIDLSAFCFHDIHSIRDDDDSFYFTYQLVRTIHKTEDFKKEYDAIRNRIAHANKELETADKRFRYELMPSAYHPISSTSVQVATFSDGKAFSTPECFNLSIAVSDIQFCRSVSVYRFVILANSSISVDGAIFHSNEHVLRYNGSGFVEYATICLRLYLDRLSSIQRNGNPTDRQWVLLHSLVVYSILKLIYHLTNLYM